MPTRPEAAGRRFLVRRPARCACLTAAVGPAITVCLGPFQLAACAPGTSRMSRSTSSGRGENGRHRASGSPAGVPHEPAPCLGKLGQRARAYNARRMKRHQLAVTVAPDHIRLTAEVAQQAEHGQAGRPTAGCATAVSIKARRDLVICVLAIGGRWEDQAGPARPPHGSSARSKSSKVALTSGNRTASSRSMPGDWAPWPGNKNATGFPAQAGRASNTTPRGSSRLGRPSAIAARDRVSFSRRSSMRRRHDRQGRWRGSGCL